MVQKEICKRLSNKDLTERLARLTGTERAALVELLIHLAEFDARRLYADEGCPSLFMYCVIRLGYSESEAYRRIYAARKSEDYPVILELLANGDTHLEGIALIGAHLTRGNHLDLLNRIRGKTRREVEAIVAILSPIPDAADVARRIPSGLAPKAPSLTIRTEDKGSPRADVDPLALEEGSATLHQSASPAMGTIHPTAPERVRFAFTGSEHLLALLRRAQEVLRHKYPAGDMEKIFLEALEALLDRKDPERKLRAKEDKAAGHAREPRPQSVWAFAMRHIPQAVKDAVWRRDGGQCVFIDPEGVRCAERGRLEYDHVVPFALGGPSNNPKNIRLLCKAHNLMMARRSLGEKAMRHQGGTQPSGTAAGCADGRFGPPSATPSRPTCG